uniref:Polymer-forming cytoskeletal protein n=1 Tax=Magnetococcus massalia (strain MO-1) TaxID=451514 RepID=A0A1S7LJB2_MAGMO|nr:Conserved protein of unknown function [Candidatus Magnetococcus massalia]
MAIFGRSAQQKTQRPGPTIIADGTKIDGLIRTNCDVHVDGTFVGEVHCDSQVTVGKEGSIEGRIFASRLVVCGHFKGDADCDEIEILSSGIVKGEIASHILVIERGSHFEGNSRLKSVEELKQSLSEVKAIPLEDAKAGQAALEHSTTEQAESAASAEEKASADSQQQPPLPHGGQQPIADMQAEVAAEPPADLPDKGAAIGDEPVKKTHPLLKPPPPGVSNQN